MKMKLWTLELNDIELIVVQDMMFYGGEMFEVRDTLTDDIILTFRE